MQIITKANLRLRLIALALSLSVSQPASAGHDHSGFIHLDTAGEVDSSCIIPGHNGGKWGCEELRIGLYHTADFASEIVITNLSAPGKPSLIVRDLTTDQKSEFIALDPRDSENVGLPLVEGENQIEFALYEDQRLLTREIHALRVVQRIRF